MITKLPLAKTMDEMGENIREIVSSVWQDYDIDGVEQMFNVLHDARGESLVTIRETANLRDFVQTNLIQLRQDAIEHGAVRVISTHNHPERTQARPSNLDIQGCTQLHSVLEEVGVELVDFTIVVQGFLEEQPESYFSFRENGLL